MTGGEEDIMGGQDGVWSLWGLSCYFGSDDNGLVLMEGKHELTAAYVALLDQVASS